MNEKKHHTKIIAEAGVNHNGCLDLAYQLIEQAAQAGADVIKFQTFCADKLARQDAPKAAYQQKTVTVSQYEMLKKLALSPADHLKLQAYCQQQKIEFLSSPFDIDSAIWLIQQLGLSCLKLGSGEITNGPLLLTIAQQDCQLIVSTGMSTLEDIELALSVLAFGYLHSDEKPSLDAFRAAYASPAGQRRLKEKVTLLHCTSQYPAPFADLNLLAIKSLRQQFQLTVGYSDHSVGITAAIGAVALGARVLEKHLTIDKNLTGPDHPASSVPEEFAALVKAIRQLEWALGEPAKVVTVSEQDTQRIARRSLVTQRAICRGETWRADMLTSKRPADGLSPMCYWDVLESSAARDYEKDEVIER